MIRLDPGWLFLLAGLSLVLAAAVIPSGRELHDLEEQLAELRHAEQSNFEVLAAYARFAQDLDDRDPALIRRLAAAQLNMMPRGETPILMASSVSASVSDWVEATVERPPYRAAPPADTLLTRWTEGQRRLWAIGAGAFMVFIGLLLSPIAARPAPASGSPAVDEEAERADAPDA